MTRAILRKLDGFFDVDDQMAKIISSVCDDMVDLPAGTVLTEQGGEYGKIFLVDGGWVVRARHLPNGARQIVNVAVPGDFVALNALLFKYSDFELICRTNVQAFQFSPLKLAKLLEYDSTLASALFWVNAHEESMLAERIVSLGRRSARARTSHVLCEFLARLEIIGLDIAERMVIPISQDDFADILGISIVHMNKTLRAMERDGVVSFRNSMLVVMDRSRLESEAGFEDGYLHFTKREDRNGGWRPSSGIIGVDSNGGAPTPG